MTDVDELHHLIKDLQGCMASLVSKHGDCPAMRRLANDAERIVNGVDRLDIDLDDLETKRGLGQPDRPTAMIQIPDTEYDIDFWRDVDHEGVGGHR